MHWDFIDTLKLTLDKCNGLNPTVIQFGDNPKDKWNKSPVVYVIRVAEGDAEGALGNYEEYYKENFCKGKCHLPPSSGKASNVLYVGKKRNDVSGRLNEHWNADPSTNSALRIIKWGKDFEFEIDLYVFPKEALTLLNALESEMASQLAPAIGQHGKI